jgi:hypothetical protein
MRPILEYYDELAACVAYFPLAEPTFVSNPSFSKRVAALVDAARPYALPHTLGSLRLLLRD